MKMERKGAAVLRGVVKMEGAAGVLAEVAWTGKVLCVHHRLDGHEFEQIPGGGDGQGSLACCSPWGHKEWDTTEQLN